MHNLGLVPTVPNIGMSLETINFQINSKLPELIDAEINKLFVFSKQWDETYLIGQTGSPTVSVGKEKYKDMAAFADTNVSPGIIKAINDNTGIMISGIRWILPTTDSDIAEMYVELNNVPWDTLAALHVGKGANDKGLSEDAAVVQDIRATANSIDRDKGVIRKSLKDVQYHLGIPLGLISMRDTISLNMVDKCQFTVEEITAAILHEIGHIFTWIEMAADLGSIGIRGNSILRNSIDYLKVNKDNDENLKNMNNEMFEEAKRLEAYIKANSKDPKVISEVKQCMVDMSKWRDIHLPAYIIFIVIVGSFVWMNIRMMFTLIAMFTFTPSMNFLNRLIATGFGSSNTRNTKTMLNAFETELFADEYVSRYSRSKQRASGIIKLENIQNALNGSKFYNPRLNAVIRNNRLLVLATTLSSFPATIGSVISKRINKDIHGGETTDLRLRKTIAHISDILNRYKLPRNVRLELVADIEAMEKMLKMHESGGSFKIPLNIIVAFLSLAPRLINASGDIIYDGGLSRDFEKIFISIDSILSNKSGYYKTKLEEFIR